MFEKAIAFAMEAHRGQLTEDYAPLPYIFHPMEVAKLLRQIGGCEDEELLAAAILHDTLEHTETTFEDLQQEFGDRVATLVQELTRTEPSPSETENLSKDEIWQLRSDLLLQGVAKMSPEAMVIKLADRMANLYVAVAMKKKRKLKRYVAQTIEILNLTQAVKGSGVHVALGSLVEGLLD
jgi:GTP diphosphokinase / guanosine-3',5'-bis(diphosphate) 3'-diphosphatase